MTRDTGFRVQDSGGGTQGEDALNPESRILDPETSRRLAWRCRRGLLELDIVLARFIERHYPELDDAQRAAFDQLLDMPDAPLWDMITGREPLSQQRVARQAGMEAVLMLLQAV